MRVHLFESQTQTKLYKISDIDKRVDFLSIGAITHPSYDMTVQSTAVLVAEENFDYNLSDAHAT